jgi:hypothetical protein
MLTVELTKADAFWSTLLCFFTNYDKSHSRIVDLPEPWQDYVLDSHIIPGVDLNGKPVKSGVALRKREDEPVTAVLRIEFPDAPSSIVERAMANIGEPYGWKTLAAFAFPKLLKKGWTERDGFTCAELIAWSCMKEGYNLWHPKADFHVITPRDIALSARGVW